jgi:outer membrane protein assembly factor BamB
MRAMFARMSGLLMSALMLAACNQASSTPAAASPSPTAHGWTMAAEVKVGRTPSPVILGGAWAFVANMSDGTVTQIERSSGRILATINVADPQVLRAQGCAPDSVHAYYSGSWGWRACDTPYAIAWDGSALWALDNGGSELVRVDPASHTSGHAIKLPGPGWSIAISAGMAWVSGFSDNHALYAADLRSGSVTTISDLDTGPATLEADATGVWVLCARAGTGHLDRIDPASAQVTARYAIEWWSTDIVADQGAIYVRGTFGGDISRVDPQSGAVVWTKPGPGFIGRQGSDQVGPAPNGLWLSGPTTARVDLATGDIVETIRVPSESLAFDGGEVWLIELNGSVAKFLLK